MRIMWVLASKTYQQGYHSGYNICRKYPAFDSKEEAERFKESDKFHHIAKSYWNPIRIGGSKDD